MEAEVNSEIAYLKHVRSKDINKPIKNVFPQIVKKTESTELNQVSFDT